VEHDRSRRKGIRIAEVTGAGGGGTSWIDDLLTADGQTLLAELAATPPSPDAEIALITRLRRRFPPTLVSAALEQAGLRVRASDKFSNAAQMYFTRAGLEQASSERIAAHHARRYAAYDRIADLCTGIGGDLIGLANGRDVLAVDIDPVHARLSRLNAAANGVSGSVMTVCADVHDIALDGIPAVFVDPARRASDRRFAVGASEPSLSWCFALAERGIVVGIKAAPGLPTDLVPSEWELEFVSEHRELKESALWSPALASVHRRATILPSGNTLVEGAGPELDVREPGSFLIDPDPAVTRAGLVRELGESLGTCWQIDQQIAFLSANADLRTPFGRTLAIEASASWSLNRLKQLLRALDVGVVDIRKRGSAVDVDEVQRRLKLTGSRNATVVLTRVANKPWMLVCFDVWADTTSRPDREGGN
jgi:predicted RNA methylase